MSATANSDWIISVQFSQVDGFAGQCFATAHKEPCSKALHGTHYVAPLRLVTGWVRGLAAVSRAIEEQIARYEAGVL